MTLLDLENKIKRIITSSIWTRIFFWNRLVFDITDLKQYVSDIFTQKESLEKEMNVVKQKLLELEVEIKTIKVTKEKTETELDVLKHQVLNPLKLKHAELNEELSLLKQAEKQKDAQRDVLMDKWEQYQSSAEERMRRNEKKEAEKLTLEKEELKRTWQSHEEHVNNLIKRLVVDLNKNSLSEKGIQFISKEEWPYSKQPDNVIKICDEFIVFDAKSPRGEELNNFPGYIRKQVDSLAKYAKHQDVKNELFLVVPENALHVIDNQTYGDSNYSVHIISPQSLRITIWALQQIENYEFAEKLSPEDRDNLARVFAGSMNYIKRVIQINSDMSEHGIELTQKMLKMIAKESLKSIKDKALQYEKDDMVNTSRQLKTKGEIIDFEELNRRHKHLKATAKEDGIILPTNTKKSIDSKSE